MKCKKCKREIEDLKICPYCKAKNIKDTVIKGTEKAIDEMDKEIKDIKFLNDPTQITNILIVGLLIYMLVSIIYSYISDLGLLDLIGNHFFYIVLTIYFILLKVQFGKKHFSYMNVVLVLLLCINFIGSLFNILTTFNFTTLFSLFVDILLLSYFSNSFFSKYLENIKPLKRINNTKIFYILSFILILLHIMLLIKYFTVLPGIKICKYIMQLLILLFFTRYIYLYKKYKEMK